jgi:hypothetical protein
MPVWPKPLQDLLEQFGISHESVHRFRFGGIVGKVALVALGGFAAAIGIAKYTAGMIQLCVLGGDFATTLLIIHWIFRYAEKHPGSATLEGAEMILWQQQQLSIAAKNMNPPLQSPVIPDPKGSMPQLNPPQEADK